MRHDKSCGAIIFRLEEYKPMYLLLYGPSYWGFTKGLNEKNESEEETAIREAAEETGIKIKLLQGFKETIKYIYRFNNELISKEAVFFIAEAKSKEVKISKEHEDFKWADFEDAIKLMKHKNQKEMLKRANDFILHWIKQKRL